MICEKRHYTYSKNQPIKGYLIKEKVPKEEKYIGYGSTNEYVGHSTCVINSTLAVISRDLYTTPKIKPLSKGVYGRGVGGYHGSEINSNSALSFSKKELLVIMEAMEDNDSLVVYSSDYTFDSKYFNTLRDELANQPTINKGTYGA
jgi:hypothetical protein